MQTTTAEALWMNENGAIYCAKHAGTALAARAARSPQAATIITDLDAWTRVTEDMREQWAAMYGPTAAAEVARCETCRLSRMEATQ